MARIQHIALVAKDPERLAKFYKDAFGMQEVHRHFTEDTPDKYTIYVSDGHINLAIFEPNPIINRPEGIYHFGFQVDDVDQAYKAAIAAGGRAHERATPRDGRFADTWILDPVGQKVDLARGWQVKVGEKVPR
jgi:catechol 2,3-dioxygenase-like lactoylglutathione lyase family enzyme